MALAMALAEVPLENYVESEPAKSEAAGVSFGATSRLLTKAVLGCPFFFQFHFCSNGIINPIKWHFSKGFFGA